VTIGSDSEISYYETRPQKQRGVAQNRQEILQDWPWRRGQRDQSGIRESIRTESRKSSQLQREAEKRVPQAIPMGSARVEKKEVLDVYSST
jgi:hypothetical protein